MDKTPTPMSEEPNTTQSAEKFISANSGAPASRSGDYITVPNARKYARLYHSEQLAQAKAPSNESIEDEMKRRGIIDPWDKMNGRTMGRWVRDECAAYITRLEQERQSALDVLGVKTVKFAELRAAMQEFIDRVDKGEVKSTRTYNKFKKTPSWDR